MAVWPERPYEVHFFEKSCSGFPKSNSQKSQNGRKWTPGRRFGHLLVQNLSQKVKERHGTGFEAQNGHENSKTQKIPKYPRHPSRQVLAIPPRQSEGGVLIKEPGVPGASLWPSWLQKGSQGCPKRLPGASQGAPGIPKQTK